MSITKEEVLNYFKKVEEYRKELDAQMALPDIDRVFHTALKTLPPDILDYDFQEWGTMIRRSITFATQFVNTFDLSQGRE